MEIFHIGAECFPVAKVGGLGDVIGALPKYQNKLGHHASVLLPCYKTKFIQENNFYCIYSNNIKLGDFEYQFKVLKESTNQLGYELFLIEIPELFDREAIYGYDDDIERFLTFQIACLDWINSRNEIPDVINCHDHHTGLIPFMILHSYRFEKLRNITTVITIHNSIYQGQFGFEKLNYLPEFHLSNIYLLEWDNKINSLAAAIKCSSKVSTVSPTYLNEINEAAFGLESLFKEFHYKSKGILNGIDTEVWNPKTDTMLAANYSISNFKKGKQLNKEKLCERFNLDSAKPLFSFIGRLLEEKGADLLAHASAIALAENFKELNIIILGSGNTAIEKDLMQLLASFKGNYNVVIGYDEALAHLLYGGSDFLLMPSRVEPCGLNQMYAMRYGTIPIVRRTGGLRDTVIDFGDDGNGICHDQATVSDVCYSIKRAVNLYKNKNKMNDIRKMGMQMNHSWETACQEYIQMYNLIPNKNEG